MRRATLLVRLVRLVGGMVVAVGQAGAGPVTITDNFDDDSLNPALWRLWEWRGNGVAVEETGQALRMSGNEPLNSAGGVMLKGTLVGDFDVQISFRMETNFDLFEDEENDSAMGILVWGPGATTFLLRSTVGAYPKTGCYLGQIDFVVEEACLAETSDQEGRIRITRSGGDYGLFRQGTGGWEELAAGASALTGPLEMYVLMSAAGGRLVEGSFDDFYLRVGELGPEAGEQPAPTDIPEPGMLFPAGVAAGWLALRRRLRS